MNLRKPRVSAFQRRLQQRAILEMLRTEHHDSLAQMTTLDDGKPVLECIDERCEQLDAETAACAR